MSWKKDDSDLTTVSMPKNFRNLAPELVKALGNDRLLVQFPEFAELKFHMITEDKNLSEAQRNKFYLVALAMILIAVVLIVMITHS